VTWFRRRPAAPPPPYVHTVLVRRHVITLLGDLWFELDAVRDAGQLARADGVKLTGRVLGTAWTVVERADAPPFAADAGPSEHDTLRLTIELERKA